MKQNERELEHINEQQQKTNTQKYNRGNKYQTWTSMQH